MNSLKAHASFRLWLTTEAHPKFPLVLLQNSLKVSSIGTTNRWIEFVCFR